MGRRPDDEAGEGGMTVPANIDISTARLPIAYEQAKAALIRCNNIDECVEWSDKAMALASYAKQADDETLERTATRIRARAIRRCGELLKQADGRGAHWSESKRDGEGLSISQRALAGQAGLSERQTKTAVRVANVPEETFERAVEGEEKVTVTKLASMGKQTRQPVADHLQGRDPHQFSAATHTMGAMRRFAEKCAEHDAAYIAAGVLPSELAEARRLVASIDAWLDRFVVNLKG